MCITTLRMILVYLGGYLLLAPACLAGPYFDRTHLWTVHNQGNIQTVLDNVGGIGDYRANEQTWPDPLTGELVSRTVYPRNSGNEWALMMSPVVGCVIDCDTLVTAGEFLPDQPPDNQFRYQTIDIGSPMYSPEAHSVFDILCQYNDSMSDPQETGSMRHRPLNIRINQRSMAWSASNIDDFIIFDLEITNFGTKVIRNGYFGLEGRLMVRHIDHPSGGYFAKSVIGSLRSCPRVNTCEIADTQAVYYSMNIDGEPGSEGWDHMSLLSALGVTFLGKPGDSPHESFTWETDLFTNEITHFRPMQRKDARQGDPWVNDGFMYYWMSNGYIAYDQMFTAVDHTDDGWYPPPGAAAWIAEGGWPRFVLGVGPFDLGPGQKATVTYALVGGENVHVNPADFGTYWDPAHPRNYYEKLDFTELMTNARWAKWVYDNPGVDTDGDGYFGKFRVCDGDTQWYEGDGVPDFRADVPPPSPKLKVIPSLGKLVIRWNGYYSENTIDPFTRQKDFEGYRVYVGLDDRESSMSTIVSWDYQNYNRYYLKKKPNNTFAWVTGDLPFTLDSLRVLYGSTFSPLLYTKDNPLHILDTLYMFSPVDYNLSSLMAPGVHKVYPGARYLGTDTSQWTEDDLTNEHGGRLPKYYEYEYEVDNLLPTIAQYVSVTAFDFGFSKGNIPAKESSKRQNMEVAYAQTSSDSAVEKGLNVYVYPNPYRLYVNYAAQGYENHDNRQIPSRSHRVNFGNLPPKCKISIFSLDGDLIRSWEHDYSPTDPQAMHDAWDLITRNTMLVVSGLYYWVVESEGRTQIGKFVVIE
jgi:hypothetical protein